MHTITKYKKGNIVKAMASGIAYFSLWGCSKMDLNMRKVSTGDSRHDSLLNEPCNSSSASTSNNAGSDGMNKELELLSGELEMAAYLETIVSNLDDSIPRSVKTYTINRPYLEKAIQWSKCICLSTAAIGSMIVFKMVDWQEESNCINRTLRKFQPRREGLERYETYFTNRKGLMNVDHWGREQAIEYGIVTNQNWNAFTKDLSKDLTLCEDDSPTLVVMLGTMVTCTSIGGVMLLNWVDNKYCSMPQEKRDQDKLNISMDELKRLKNIFRTNYAFFKTDVSAQEEITMSTKIGISRNMFKAVCKQIYEVSGLIKGMPPETLRAALIKLNEKMSNFIKNHTKIYPKIIRDDFQESHLHIANAITKLDHNPLATV